MLGCFNTIPERDGQTDGQAEFLYQYRASAVINTYKLVSVVLTSLSRDDR